MDNVERVDGYAWHEYWQRVRSVLRHEYGLVRVPKDVYKEQFCVANSVQRAAQQIALRQS